MCLVVATSNNVTHPGSFQSNLDKLLVANNLPKFSLGGVAAPSSISIGNNSPPNGGHRLVSVPDETVGVLPESHVQVEKECVVYRRRGSQAVTCSNFGDLLHAGTVYVDHCCDNTEICIKDFSQAQSSGTTLSPLEGVIEVKDGEYDIRKKSNLKPPSTGSKSLRSTSK
jgi:hypothetical protein